MSRATDAASARSRRRYMALKAENARGIAVDRMSDSALWNYAMTHIERSQSHSERHESREAFYAAVRAGAAVQELYVRGIQLEIPGTDGHGPSMKGDTSPYDSKHR